MDNLVIFLDAICEKGKCQTMPLDEFTKEQLELLENYELSGNCQENEFYIKFGTFMYNFLSLFFSKFETNRVRTVFVNQN